jgi:hypothetical protein
VIRSSVRAGVPLAKVADAHRAGEQGDVHGKLVLVIDSPYAAGRALRKSAASALDRQGSTGAFGDDRRS